MAYNMYASMNGGQAVRKEGEPEVGSYQKDGQSMYHPMNGTWIFEAGAQDKGDKAWMDIEVSKARMLENIVKTQDQATISAFKMQQEMAKAAAQTKNKLTGPWKGESNIRSTSKVDIVKRIVKRSGSPGRAQGVSGVCAQQHEPKRSRQRPSQAPPHSSQAPPHSPKKIKMEEEQDEDRVRGEGEAAAVGEAKSCCKPAPPSTRALAQPEEEEEEEEGRALVAAGGAAATSSTEAQTQTHTGTHACAQRAAAAVAAAAGGGGLLARLADYCNYDTSDSDSGTDAAQHQTEKLLHPITTAVKTGHGQGKHLFAQKKKLPSVSEALQSSRSLPLPPSSAPDTPDAPRPAPLGGATLGGVALGGLPLLPLPLPSAPMPLLSAPHAPPPFLQPVPAGRPSNYKTVMCKYWLERGVCDKKDECNYAHGRKELRD